MKKKINLSKLTFYLILFSSLLIIVLITINSIIASLSTKQLDTFLINYHYDATTADQGERHFRMLLIIKALINSLILIFFALYSYFAFIKIEVGYGFVLFWSFILIGNILGAWLIPGSVLWFQISSTIISLIGIFGLFNQFLNLNQFRFYSTHATKWGA